MFSRDESFQLTTCKPLPIVNVIKNLGNFTSFNSFLRLYLHDEFERTSYTGCVRIVFEVRYQEYQYG